MAMNSDLDRVGRSSLTVPDPMLNASQILAWAICWPWNLLWTVCAYNPVFWIIEVAVREFRSGLEEISSGQFREIKRELSDEAAASPPVVAPWAAASERPSLVVGDPQPGWQSRSDRPEDGDVLPQVAVAAATQDQGLRAGATTVDASHDAGDVRDAVEEVANEVDSWSWAPPVVERDRRAAQQSANWYPVGELKNAPQVSAVPLKSAISQRSTSDSSARSIPPSVLDAWGNLPPADGRSSPPLN